MSKFKYINVETPTGYGQEQCVLECAYQLKRIVDLLERGLIIKK